jgi:hypothetical protein
MHLFKGNIVLDACNNLFQNTHIAKDNYFYHGYMCVPQGRGGGGRQQGRGGAWLRERRPLPRPLHHTACSYGNYTPECCPRYLQPQHFAALKASVDRIDIRTGTLQDVASQYPDGFFSRYILLDHMDWMPMSMVLDEWSVFVRKARADCRFLWRSFSTDQHIAPLKYLDYHYGEGVLLLEGDRLPCCLVMRPWCAATTGL